MSYGSDGVEVLSAVQRRRRYLVDQKMAVLDLPRFRGRLAISR
jgi:hypothetical protein